MHYLCLAYLLKSDLLCLLHFLNFAVGVISYALMCYILLTIIIIIRGIFLYVGSTYSTTYCNFEISMIVTYNGMVSVWFTCLKSQEGLLGDRRVCFDTKWEERVNL